jgi:hypothetical protein
MLGGCHRQDHRHQHRYETLQYASSHARIITELRAVGDSLSVIPASHRPERPSEYALVVDGGYVPQQKQGDANVGRNWMNFRGSARVSNYSG